MITPKKTYEPTPESVTAFIADCMQACGVAVTKPATDLARNTLELVHNATGKVFLAIITEQERTMIPRQFQLDQRVRLLTSVERFPHFTIDAGKTGIITEMNNDTIWVKMDELVPGCEEWSNRLIIYRGLDDIETMIAPIDEPERELADCQICGASEMDKQELWIVGYMDRNSSERGPFWSTIMAAPPELDMPEILAKAKQALRDSDMEMLQHSTGITADDLTDYDDSELEWFADHVMNPIVVRS